LTLAGREGTVFHAGTKKGAFPVKGSDAFVFFLNDPCTPLCKAFIQFELSLDEPFITLFFRGCQVFFR
jgi:hypothetical protein